MFQYKLINNFLTESQCQSILDYSLNNLKLETAKIIGEKSSVIDSHRKSKICFDKYENFEFLNEKMMNLVSENVSVNGYDIKWNKRGYQFTSYDVNEYYNWHTDVGHERYCSVVIQLNEDYNGGDLELVSEDNTLIMNHGIGNAVIFLSNINHRVTEVLKGTRYSLVNWLSLLPKNEHKKSII
jgi:hypothetical protein